MSRSRLPSRIEAKIDPPVSSVRSRVAVHAIWAIVVLTVLTGVYTLANGLRQDQRDLREDVAGVLRGAFGADVTHRFYSSGPELRTGSGLQLVGLTMAESFERTRVARFLGIEGVSEVQIDVPVTYDYQVPWDSGWRIVLSQAPSDTTVGASVTQLCVVEAPALEPRLPPSIHTEKMRIRRAREWRVQRFDPAMVDSVLLAITPETTRRARSDEYRALVRETARKRLKEFIRLWVLGLEEVPEDMPVQIYVRFADDEQELQGEQPFLSREFQTR